MQYFQVYTVTEDVYKGKDNKIGATGLKVLYYHVQDGTSYMESEEFQKIHNKLFVEEKPCFHIVSQAILE